MANKRYRKLCSTFIYVNPNTTISLSGQYKSHTQFTFIETYLINIGESGLKFLCVN